MFIWVAGKSNLWPNYQAWFRARAIVKAAKQSAQEAAKNVHGASQQAAKPLFTAHPHGPHGQHRTFTTLALRADAKQYKTRLNLNLFSSSKVQVRAFSFKQLLTKFEPKTFVPLSACALPVSVSNQPTANAPTSTMDLSLIAASPVDPLPFHNVERLAGVYDPAVVQHVLDHAIEIWSVVKIEGLILDLHAASGLPWWATIVASTILLRCVTVPFVTVFLKHQSKAKIAKARLVYLHERMESPDATDDEKLACANEVLATFKEKNLKVVGDWIIPIGFPPLMLSFFGAVHNLCLQEGLLSWLLIFLFSFLYLC